MPKIRRPVQPRFEDLDDVNFTTGAGTDGQIIFYDNGSEDFIGDSGLTYDESANELSLTGGLISPVVKPASDSTTAIQLQDSGGTEIFNVDTTNGRVGIGEDTPLNPLHVTYTGDTEGLRLSNSGALIIGPNSTDSVVRFFSTFSNAAAWNYVIGLEGGSSGNGQLRFLTGALGSSTERLTITRDGDVGLSNNSPTAILDVPAATTSKASIRIRDGTAPTSPNDGDIWQDGSDLLIRIGGTTYTLDKTSV